MRRARSAPPAVALLAVAALMTSCSSGSPSAGRQTSGTPTSGTPTSAASGSAGPGAPASPTAAPAPAPGSPAAPTAVPSPTVGTPGECATADLTVTIPKADHAAGSTYLPLTFRNTGTSTCHLDGHPGVSFVAGTDGHQVGAAAGRDGTPGLVTLGPGEYAHAALRVVLAGNYDPAECRPIAVRGFRVYPPDQTASVFVRHPTQACQATDVGLLTVEPVQPGASDS